jgi:AcrR family transcriptional regulator
MASPQSGPDSQKIAGISSHDRILQSAKHLFATRGYENTSTVAIARAAGTSESQLIKHFGSKEGLLEAIFDNGWERMSGAFPALQPIASPAERLEALLEMILSALERDSELKQLMLLEGRRIRKEGHMVLLTGGYQRLVQMADGMLAEMRSKGELRDDVEPQAVRSALMGMQESMMRDQVLAERMGFPAKFKTEDLRKIFHITLGAFSKKLR